MVWYALFHNSKETSAMMQLNVISFLSGVRLECSLLYLCYTFSVFLSLIGLGNAVGLTSAPQIISSVAQYMTFIHGRFNFTGYSLYFSKLIFVILSILAKSSCPQFSFMQTLPTFAVLKK